MLSIRLVLADPALRIAGLVLILHGSIICGFGPYFSTLSVNTFQLGDAGFAVLLALATMMSVAASVTVGIRADQTANRRTDALFAVVILVVGMGLMTFAPGREVFVLVAALMLPLSSTLFGQVFALARLAASTYPPEHRDGILAVIRALFAASFVLVLPVWSLAFSSGVTLLTIFPVGFVIALVMLLVVARYWPRDGATAWTDRKSGLSFGASLTEMIYPALALRVVALGAVIGISTIYMALISLLMVAAEGRGTADVALYVGLVAGLEVPFMLLLPTLSRGQSRTGMILWGTALYAVHVALLPVLASTALVWLLVLPAAVGGAIILTVPIAYLQDLMADRPGAGASLLAVQRLIGDILAALCFAAGTAIAGYGLVAALGVIVAVTGAVWLQWVDKAPINAARQHLPSD